ncbi:hypothetical protein LXL04_029703 [Taraxacum kok-saghyz]
MGIRNHEEEQWTRVNHRKKQTCDRNGSHGGQSQHVSEPSRSFFFTNFPQSITVNDVWRVCSRIGRVVDVYISPHLSKMGKRFGFIRFAGIRSDQEIIEKLNDTWFGYYKLFASVPTYPKQDNAKPKAVHGVKPKPKMPIMKSLVEKRNGDGFSYASVVSGNLKSHSQPKEKVKEVVLELMSGDFVVTNRLTACYGKVRDFLTLPNLRLLCMDEGFDEVELWYVGGLWVLFKFQSEEMCRNFMMNEVMDHWLSEKKTWDRNFVPMDRIGLPIRAWSKSAFRQIVSKWGVVLHLDDDLGEDVYKNQVCVLTTHHHIISEALKIQVDGQMLVVRVKEAPGWSPTFAKGDPKQDTQNMEDDKVCEYELQDDLNADNEE